MQEKRQEIITIMSRINRKLFTANSNTDDSFIGKGQINILKEIINHEKITQDELASVLNLDKTTIAKAVKRLETHDLIIRNRSETDLRKKELVATKKALVVKEHMTKHLEENNKLFFDGITEQEIEIFKDVLEKIEVNIEIGRNIKNEKKQIGIKIVKLIEKNEGLTAPKLAELLGSNLEGIKEIIEKLIIKEFIEEKSGVLNLTKKAREHNEDKKDKC
jgi:DNA-binding MarR family transcriptional regulator